jgi:hypothetical protein
MLKHYVRFCYPGVLVNEYSDLKIKSRDSEFDIPKNCFGYYFFDKEQIKKKKEILTGKQKNNSGMSYINGKIFTKSEVKELYGEESNLYRNMKGNNYKRVIKTRCNNFQPFSNKDKNIIE